MVIDVLNNLNCLEVVFQNSVYCEYFYLLNFDLFLCIDKMICLAPCTFEVYSGCLVVLSAFSNAISVSSAIVTPIFE